MKPFIIPIFCAVALLAIGACAGRRSSDDAYWRRATPEISKHLPR
jgi:hypothetical protein